MDRKKQKKQEAYIRSDGWVISAEGMERLVKSGRMGQERYMEWARSRLGGGWRRVLRPLDRDAAASVKSVTGMVARAEFVSRAIVEHAARCAASKEGK